MLADHDHVFFEYHAKHKSDAVCAMFRGYSGCLQADAHAIYDAFLRGDAVADGVDPPDAKHAIGREGLYRIRKLFELDGGGRQDMFTRPPVARLSIDGSTFASLLAGIDFTAARRGWYRRPQLSAKSQ